MPIHLNREIDRLKKLVLSLCAIVEESVRQAGTAVLNRDGELAGKVIEGDVRIDHAEIDVEEECLKILALHQPVAIDLRYIIAVLKLNNDLERIGDLAVNIAERAVALASVPPVQVPFDLSLLIDKTREMLRSSLDALVNMDGDAARKVCAMDDEIDDMNRELCEKVKQVIREKPGDVDALITFFSVSRALERIGDHATNIAEDVMYTNEGRIVRHGREFGLL